MVVGGAGVDRHQLPAAQVERDGLDRERGEVDAQRVALLAQQRGDLVEQPGLGADPVVLDPRAELRQLQPVGLLGPRHAEQREAQRRLQRRRGGQAGAARDVAGEAHARRDQRDPARGELGDDAAREGAPALRGLDAREREVVVLAEVLGRDLEAVAVERLGRGGDAAVDRERQREAAVVVRVLADQVDAAGAACANGWSRDRRRRRCRCRGRGSAAASSSGRGRRWARGSAPAWRSGPAARASAPGSTSASPSLLRRDRGAVRLATTRWLVLRRGAAATGVAALVFASASVSASGVGVAFGALLAAAGARLALRLPCA